MVLLIKITPGELKALIKLGFSDDADLLKYYHDLPEKSWNTLDECVEHTFGLIEEAIGDWRLEVHLFKIVIHDIADDTAPGIDVGYTVLIKSGLLHKTNILYSFAINGKYRTDSVKWGWLEEIKEFFKHENFFVKLEVKNTRAVGYFLKNKFEKIPVLSDSKHDTLLSS